MEAFTISPLATLTWGKSAVEGESSFEVGHSLRKRSARALDIRLKVEPLSIKALTSTHLLLLAPAISEISTIGNGSFSKTSISKGSLAAGIALKSSLSAFGSGVEL